MFWSSRGSAALSAGSDRSGRFFTLTSQALSRGFPLLFAIFFLVAVVYNTVFPGDDPHRCRAALQTGRWLDRPDDHGDRKPFHLWQPDGCMVHKYSPNDIKACLGDRSIMIGGDSTSRGVAYGFGRLLGKDKFKKDVEHHGKGDIFNKTYNSVNLLWYPNWWLQGHETNDREAFMKQVDTYALEKLSVPENIASQAGPGLIYTAGGAWYTNVETYTHEKIDRAGRMQAFRDHVTNLSEAIGYNGHDFVTKSMDKFDGVGNQIFFGPPAGPHYEGDDAEILEDKIRRISEVHEMQDWLREVDDDLSYPVAWAIADTVQDQNKTWRDDKPGFHVIDTVAEARANILLNLRCNAVLDRVKSYPNDRTCCTDYGSKPLVQTGVVITLIVYVLACLVYSTWDWSRGDEPRDSMLDMQAGVFALALLMCYFADRTQMMAKGVKVYYYLDFAALLAMAAVPTILTIRRSRKKTGGYKEIPLDAAERPVAQPDEPLLSRDQTEEWKGWMQVIILGYHWTNAWTANVYPVIRVLVAAYLFQTGYGHTLFFLSKSDFSFKRLASVILRLNLLSCSLAYVMDTDYMLYYFSPLVTFWYLVVFATMGIAHKRFNSNAQLVIVKICISCLLVTVLTTLTPATKWFFYLLGLVFKIHWSYNEWYSRVTLDIYIVYIGMLFAVGTKQLKSSVHFGLRMTLAVAGIFACYLYFHAGSNAGMKVYKTWHPYFSFIPIFAFIALRNCAGPVRNYYSKAMAWLGRCSLETYTLQFHLLLAGDTHGVLLVDGFFGDGTLFGDRWRSLIIILPIFLWLSSAAGNATGHIVKCIMHAPDEAELLDSNSKLYKLMERWGINSWVSLPKLRVAGILLIMWLLNLLSPGHENHPIPHGTSAH